MRQIHSPEGPVRSRTRKYHSPCYRLDSPNLAQVLVPGGILITSGIIEERRHEAEQPLLTAGLKLIDQVMINDWVNLNNAKIREEYSLP